MMLFSLAQAKTLGRYAVLSIFLILFASTCNTGGNTTPAQNSACTALNPSDHGGSSAVLANVPIPGKPFKAVATGDGQWMFVSFNGNNATASGVAVLHKQGSQICLQREIALSGIPFGMTLSRDGRILVPGQHIYSSGR